jgi:hypothetical protein
MDTGDRRVIVDSRRRDPPDRIGTTTMTMRGGRRNIFVRCVMQLTIKNGKPLFSVEYGD